MTLLCHALCAYRTLLNIPLSILFSLLAVSSHIPLYAAPSSPPKVQPPSAHAKCGQDRRCRIERLKRLTQAQRESALKMADFRAYRFNEENDQREKSAYPRINKPFNVDINYFLWVAGFSASYQLSAHFQTRFEAGVGLYSDTSERASRFIDFYSDDGINTFRLNITYLNSQDALSSYVNLGLSYLIGIAEVYDSNASASGGVLGQLGGIISNTTGINLGGSNGGPTSGVGEFEAHLASVGAGFDYQHQSGFHARLGLSYTRPIFVGHRDADGRQNLPTKQSAEDWTSDILDLSIDFLLGWAF